MINRFYLPYFMAAMVPFLGGCGRRPLNLTQAKNRVECYYNSGKFDEELKRITDKAAHYFSKRAPQRHDAVIFDIDDTVLSTYEDMRSIHFGYIPKLSHLWILEAKAPALVPVRDLYNQLVAQGYHIIFLSGRKHNEYDATLKNLREQGYATYDKLILRSEQQEGLPACEYKSAMRKKLAQEGYRIVGCVGDQWSDLKGGNAGQYVKIPNYTYIIE